MKELINLLLVLGITIAALVLWQKYEAHIEYQEFITERNR